MTLRKVAMFWLGLSLSACTGGDEPDAAVSGGSTFLDSSIEATLTGGSGGDAGTASAGSSGGSGGANQDSGIGGSMSSVYPGSKAHYSVVYGNLDTKGTTWVRHANYTFSKNGGVTATLWQWDSKAKKGKTAYTQHRCTMNGVTKDCFTYTPTGWSYPGKQHFAWVGSFQLLNQGTQLRISTLCTQCSRTRAKFVPALVAARTWARSMGCEELVGLFGTVVRRALGRFIFNGSLGPGARAV